MRHKKFFLIPILILLYLFFIVPLLVSISFTPSGESTSEGQSSGEILNMGFSSSVSVSVTRPYLFGLLELPVYSSGLGDISFFHTAFFVFIVALTIIFIIMEWRKKHG